jgi:methylmalonyl-CoA mutase N-terminal domain/subunit
MSTNVNALKKRWENSIVDKVISKSPERKKSFFSDSGIELERIYLPDNSIDYEERIGFPGEFPFTRGVYPTMYRSRFWTMRQYAGYATAKESNKRYRYLLESGTTGLSVAFDLPTQMGYDSDDPLAEGEVGKVGVAIDSLKDMEILFDEIPLDKVSTSMTINSTAAILLALYIAVAKKQEIDIGKISGTIQNDILKEYIARGTYIYPPEQSMRIITDIFKYCHNHLPHWNTISISGYHIREAGSTAVQEVAFTFANAIAYVNAAIESGLNVDDFAERLSFFFNSHNNLLEEIAKFRAARRMWANIMRNRFGAKNPNSMKLRFHTQTAGSSLTAQQPLNNTIRTTIQALAAVAGGTQSLHTNSYDEALALPTEESVKIALRTQQIIAYESGIGDTVDPFAGSYVIEYLTDEIEKRAFDYIEKIDKLGGAIEAVKLKYFQNEIAQSSYQYQKKMEEQKRIIVGLNRFQEDQETPLETLKIDEKAVKDQIVSLQKLRKNRNSEKVKDSLNFLKNAAKGDDNLMPFVLDCVEQYCTVGEISNALRSVFSEYQE